MWYGRAHVGQVTESLLASHVLPTGFPAGGAALHAARLRRGVLHMGAAGAARAADVCILSAKAAVSHMAVALREGEPETCYSNSLLDNYTCPHFLCF